METTKEIDLTYVFKNLDGSPIRDQKQIAELPGGKAVMEAFDFTMKMAIVKALTTQDNTADGNEKFKRYQFAKRVQGTKEKIILNEDEIHKICTLIGQQASPLLTGQAWEQMGIENMKEPTP